MKRDSLSAYIHMRRGTTLTLYAPVHILNDTTSIPPVVYALNGPIFQRKTSKNIRMKYKHSKKIIYEKINGSVG